MYSASIRSYSHMQTFVYYQSTFLELKHRLYYLVQMQKFRVNSQLTNTEKSTYTLKEDYPT